MGNSAGEPLGEFGTHSGNYEWMRSEAERLRQKASFYRFVAVLAFILALVAFLVGVLA